MTIAMDHAISIDALGSEHRTQPRQRVLKGATGSFNGGFGAFECVVRNQSRNGARLSFGDTAVVPAAFTLRVIGEAAARTARVRWRTMTAIGVELD